MACCELPHDPRMTCEEIAWAVAAPTEEEAFRRSMAIVERIQGSPVEIGEQRRQRQRFRHSVRQLGQAQDRSN